MFTGLVKALGSVHAVVPTGPGVRLTIEHAEIAAKTSVGAILLIMFFGVLVGQLCSYKILTSPPFEWMRRRYVAAGYASLVFAFSTFTYFPPQMFLFENYLCYEYTNEYGILDDYAPYRMFRKPGEEEDGGNSIWYCQNQPGEQLAAN